MVILSSPVELAPFLITILRIFILEGLLTVVVACATPFILPDDPKTAKFITEDERNFLMYRIMHDQGREGMQSESAEPFQWKYFWAASKDWKVWLSILVYWGNSMPVYGYLFHLRQSGMQC